MSLEETFHLPSLLKSIDAWYAENISELEAYRLKELLRSDPQARQVFVEYGDMLASLELYADTDQHALTERVPLPSLELTLDHARPLNRREWSIVAAVAATCLLVGFFLLQLSPPHAVVIPSVQANHAPGGQPGVSIRPPFAVVTEIFTDHHELEQSSLSTAAFPGTTGTELAIGLQFLGDDRLIIDQAGLFVKVRFASGAELLVQGPALLYFESGNAARLDSGRVLGMVPPQASGFSIRLPHGIVRDLGTEFAIALNGTEADVSVLSGTVEYETPPDVRGVTNALTLHAGETVKTGPAAPDPVVEYQAPASLTRIVSHRSGIVRTTGDVQVGVRRPRLPGEKFDGLVTKMLLMPERHQVSLLWDAATRKFSPGLQENPGAPSFTLRAPVQPELVSSVLEQVESTGQIDVDSYLLDFFPTSISGPSTILSGSIVFQREILAIFTTKNGLINTDGLAVSPEFADAWYTNSPLARGSREANDKITISEDGHTLSVQLQAGGAGDQLRVFVRAAETHLAAP